VARVALVLLALLAPVVAAAGGLEPLPYANPGLVVDLGVGLWAWPVPCDADGDGDHDLLVSCPDKPSNGVWFFENPGTDTAVDPLPVFRPGRRLGPTVHYVMPSYIDGRMRVLAPGVEFVRALRRCRDAATGEWTHALDLPCDAPDPDAPQPLGYVR
jgi:hypothetical protein